MDRQDIVDLFDAPRLSKALDLVDEQLSKVAAMGGALSKQLAFVTERHGKRLRPLLLMASAGCCGRTINKNVVCTAAAVELVHLAALTHDDVLDGDIKRPETGLAILIGDYLLSAGLELAASTAKSDAELLARTIKKMAAGQAMQLDNRYRTDVNDDYYLHTLRNKTASLFVAACQLGSSGAAETVALVNYAEAFGSAFQIIDDINDHDFKGDGAAQAKQAAANYSALARNFLKPLGDSPFKDGLGQLPTIYLQISVT